LEKRKLHTSTFGYVCTFTGYKRKDDFEAAFISAIYKVFPGSAGVGCKFRFNQYPLRLLQNTGVALECKATEQVGLTCRMCAALGQLLIRKVEERWLMIMKNVLQNEKLTLFLDYYIQQ
jgi:hypothetical protein